MNESKAIAWLRGQLPGLVEKGVLAEASADAIRTHYAHQRRKSGISLALLFFGVLGSLLIGAGIILLLAHNWQDMGRPMRTVLSLLPLILAQVLSGWILWRGISGVVWRESAGILHSLAVAASIALIAQTYHMPGSFDTFLLTWMLLSLPLVYLHNAVAPLMIYLAGITSWAGYQQSMGEHALLYWPLAALAVPFIWRSVRAERFSPRAAVVQWCAVIAATCALGIVLEKGMPGLWIPFYTSLFAGLYLAGGLAGREDEVSGWLRPARLFGMGATLVFVFLLTWEWPWQSIGWRYLRWNQGLHTVAAWVDGVVGLALLVFVVSMLTTSIRRKRAWDMLLGASVPVVIVCYSCAASGAELLATVLMNVYAMVVGIGLVVQGVREVRLLVFNAGMIVFSALVVARFFDSDFSFIAKGLVFIVLGIAFLVCNIILSRRKERLS
ncbi:MAG: DUF2157 domain-containing protein [Kiritimatiellia bacterium]